MFKPKIIRRYDGKPYLVRWHIIPRNRFFNISLHKFVNDDDDRALHDHPWGSLSIRLSRATFREHYAAHHDLLFAMPAPVDFDMTLSRLAPRVCFRPAKFAHRLELINGAPVWTLFITGSRVREWGFHCPKGWRHWRTMTTLEGKSIGSCDNDA